MIIWCITVLIQIHTTPGNSLVLAYGKTKALVLTTAISCVLSIVINVVLARRFGAGSAVIAYFIYVSIVIGLYYLHYYKSLLRLNRWKMFLAFIIPTAVAAAVYVPCHLFLKLDVSLFGGINERVAYILICLIKTLAWLLPYAVILLALGVLKPSEFKGLVKK